MKKTRKVTMTYGELRERFYENEAEGRPPITGYIVFTENSFAKVYQLESRTYEVRSDNKAYKSGQLGYSIFGYCLDGTDQGIRLEQYMAVEKGGSNGWVVDYCYMFAEEDKEEN